MSDGLFCLIMILAAWSACGLVGTALELFRMRYITLDSFVYTVCTGPIGLVIIIFILINERSDVILIDLRKYKK